MIKIQTKNGKLSTSTNNAIKQSKSMCELVSKCLGIAQVKVKSEVNVISASNLRSKFNSDLPAEIKLPINKV